ncbi:MAG: OmpA family protein [Pseudomonadota bacterium]|nr:OmpA family protein [Pseudomonadota bacterium]
MKTRLLPLVALISMTACSSVFAANQGYVTDSDGNIVKDNYGNCVRSIDWTPEMALSSCEAKPEADVSKVVTSKAKAQPAPSLLPAVSADIDGSSQSAYVVDSYGSIVRDGYGYCVRTIDWTKETAINKCEGWEEPKPVVVKKPAPVIIAKPAPKPVPKPVVVEDAPAAFYGFFGSDEAKLTETATHKLDIYSDYMKRHSAKTVKVTGHTDSTGSEAYNQALSEKRAQAVKTYLESNGIESQRIQAQGMGESQPIASNDTQSGRAENRRVELEIIK